MKQLTFLIGVSEVSTRHEFGRALTALREAAGLTVRDVAKRVGLPPATVGGYFSGRHLPAARPPDLLDHILRACGVSDPAEIERWHQALLRARRTPGRRPADAPAPYRGLAAFDVEDAEWFFGREDLTAQLVARLTAEPSGLVLVVGPSGSGKSSLIRAGGLASLETPATIVTPGRHPRVPDAETLVVDQFEELFTVCADEAERRDFVEQLCAAAAERLVVVGLRADFYPHALRYPQLAAALQHSQVVVGPMTEDELRRAIVEPARHAQIDLEDGLVELLLRDHGELPLLAHALRATWERRRPGRMTVADYRDTGGVHGAVARSAEAVCDGLDTAEQEQARRLFLRLVQVNPGAVDTRRRIPRPEEDTPVLERFIEARLITADAGELEIAHEALLSAWPRLRAWIDADRAGLRIHRQLADAAQAWHDAGYDRQALYRGVRLAVAEEWLRGDRSRVNALERRFFDASVEHERAEVRLARRRLTTFVAVLSTLLLATTALAVLAFRARADATRERDLAVSRQIATTANQLRASAPGLAMQLALAAYRVAPTVEARSSLLSTFVIAPVTRVLGPPGVMQAVAVSRDGTTMATAGADNAVRRYRNGRPLGGPLTGHTGTIFALAFSPDGAWLASAGGDRTIRLWRPDGSPGPTLTGAGNTVYSLAFSPDGRTLAAGGADNTIRFFDVSHFTSYGGSLGFAGFVQSVAYSPDGTLLAAGSADTTVRIWNVADPAHPVPVGGPLTGATKTVFAVAFSPDGHTLAAGSADSSIRRWSLADPAHPVPVGRPLMVGTGWVNSIAFDPDGRTMVAGASDSKLYVWDTASWALRVTLPHPAPVTTVAYVGGTHTVATSCADGTARLWQLPGPVLGGPTMTVFNALYATDRPVLEVTSGDGSASRWDVHDPLDPAPLGRPFAVADSSGASAISPSGDLLAIGTRGGSIELWGTSLLARVPAHTKLVESLAFSPDGRLLAATSDDKTATLWDVRDPGHPVRLAQLTGPANYVYSAAFRPDGRVFAVGSADNTIRLWDIADPAHPVPLGGPLTGPASYVWSVAFSPSGRLLAAGSADNTVRLWNVTDPAHPVPLGAPLRGPDNYVISVAFDPRSNRLAAGAGDGTIWVWDVTDPRHPVTVDVLTGHSGAVFTVAFDPRSDALASGGADKQTRLWDLDPADVARRICATAGDPITAAEWQKYVPGRPFSPPC